MRPLGLEWRQGILTIVQAGTGGPGEVRWGKVRLDPSHPDAAGKVVALLEGVGLVGGPARLALGGDSIAVKPIDLPPLPESDRRALLIENGERFFLRPEGERCYAILGEAESGETWVAAAAAAEVASLMEVCAAAGIHVEQVTAALAAYPLAALDLTGDRPDGVVRLLGGDLEWVACRAGVITDLQLAHGDGADELRKRILPEAAGPAKIALFSDADPGPEWRAESIVRPVTQPPGCAASIAGALGAAAASATQAPLPDLTPPAVQRRRVREERRRTLVLAAGTVVLLAFFLALLVGERRSRAARLEEALIEARAQAEPVLEMRIELNRLQREILAYRRLREERTDWLNLFAELSETLPEDAWLATFESRPGEIIVSGYADSSTEVVAALSSAPFFETVRFERPASRTSVAGRTVEAFTLAVAIDGGPAE